MDELVLGVADVKHNAAGRESWAELLDDGFNKQAPAEPRGIVQRTVREMQTVCPQEVLWQP